jgi:methanogenic corrinoid protein MtbC1
MSLLMRVANEKTESLAKRVFDRHFEMDPRLHKEYDERRKMLMYEDILYNLGYLDAAVTLHDDHIFMNYAVWLYHLMCGLMKDLPKERLRDQMITHYTILSEEIGGILSDEDAVRARQYIALAIDATQKECVIYQESDRFQSGNYCDIKSDYLQCMLGNNTKGAFQVVENASQSGVTLPSVYIDILQEVMYEVGNLWQQSRMTVATEHYCTSTTQVALSQFYPVIFNSPRNGHRILTLCVGSELHEMGIRMVSDLFEYHGWDSIYLGAAVPKAAILHAIEEYQPELIGLSVTMPQHLPDCLDIVNEIRAKYRDVKIAVGGRAFQTTNQIWKNWDIDTYSEDANQFVAWAADNIIHTRTGQKHD